MYEGPGQIKLDGTAQAGHKHEGGEGASSKCEKKSKGEVRSRKRRLRAGKVSLVRSYVGGFRGYQAVGRMRTGTLVTARGWVGLVSLRGAAARSATPGTKPRSLLAGAGAAAAAVCRYVLQLTVCM